MRAKDLAQVSRRGVRVATSREKDIVHTLSVCSELGHAHVLYALLLVTPFSVMLKAAVGTGLLRARSSSLDVEPNELSGCNTRQASRIAACDVNKRYGSEKGVVLRSPSTTAR